MCSGRANVGQVSGPRTTGRVGVDSYTVKAAARPPAFQKTLVQFAEPDVAVADWVVVPRGAGQLDGTLIFCYIVPVEKCVQKAGDSSRFFYFRCPLIGFRGYIGARHRRARPATPSNPKIVIPPALSNAEGTLGMRSCLPAEAGAEIG